MTMDEIMAAAAQDDFAFETAAFALHYYRDEQRSGGAEYWDERGLRALLEAAEAILQQAAAEGEVLRAQARARAGRKN